MKRFWLILLSLGLVMAFSASAMAVDVKFSGSFYAAGMYLDRTSLKKDIGPSTAFYFQRLRVGTEFVVSPGLSLVTRFDAMERVWGQARSSDAVPTANIVTFTSAGKEAENENIAFDIAYIKYASPIGLIQAGYQPDGVWGTQFSDYDGTLGKITYIMPIGSMAVGGYIAKTADAAEKSNTAKASVNQADADTDKYVLFVNYNSKAVSGGLLGAYYRVAKYRGATAPISAYGIGLNSDKLTANAYILDPYFKAKFGPVTIEGEMQYLFGKAKYEADAAAALAGKEVDLGQIAAYIGAMVELGPVYFGAKFAYMSGDDPTTSDKWEGGQIGGGYNWNPCLIMFNFDRTNLVGTLAGHSVAVSTYNYYNTDSFTGLFGSVGMTNASFYQGIIGVRPTEKLDIMASVSYANAVTKPTSTVSDNYGWEVDATGTYKITNNLSYMLGFGYMITGDYFKGTSANNQVTNDYLIINKLTLTF